MSTTTSAREYPVACPECDQLKGYPYQVRTMTEQRGSIDVKLRCRECSHEWVEVIDNTD
jgi:hypothetical protein